MRPRGIIISRTCVVVTSSTPSNIIKVSLFKIWRSLALCNTSINSSQSCGSRCKTLANQESQDLCGGEGSSLIINLIDKDFQNRGRLKFQFLCFPFFPHPPCRGDHNPLNAKNHAQSYAPNGIPTTYLVLLLLVLQHQHRWQGHPRYRVLIRPAVYP